MKLKRGIIPIAIIGALLVSLFAPLAVSANGPVLPTSFYGDVTVNDTAASVDTVITGRIVDAVGSPGEGTITVTEEGKYGVSGLGSKLTVTTDSLDDVDKEIEFYVKLPEWAEAQKADPYPTATYDSDTHQVNLTITLLDVTYALTMVAAPDIGGTATDMTADSPYVEGASVNIKAVAEEGYQFVNWTSDPAGIIADEAALETSLTMPGEAVTATANFELIPTYALTMVAAPDIGGTATDMTADSPYVEGASVNIKAVAIEGYQFVNWTAPAGTFLDADAEETTFTMPGEVVTVTANFEALIPPVAEFTSDVQSGDEPLTVVFADASENMTNNPEWSWDFGDGETSIDQNPTHEYLQDGSYTVTLTVTTDEGTNSEAKADYIEVFDTEPVASFTAAPIDGEYPLEVTFHDTSTSYDDNIILWEWDFSYQEELTFQAESSVQNPPVYTYGDAGTYTVALRVTDADDDSDMAEVIITVTPPTPPTVESTLPLDAAIDVAIDVVVSATFDEDIQAGANIGDITISGATVVSTSIDGATLTIAHAAFAYGTLYTVTIPAEAVDDLDAHPLAEDKVWSFTTIVQYALFVSSSDGGSVTQPGEPGPFHYPVGTVVNLLAEPDDGYELGSWTGDVADVNAASTTITMDSDKTIVANFVLFSAPENVSITEADPGVESVTVTTELVANVDVTEIPAGIDPQEAYVVTPTGTGSFTLLFTDVLNASDISVYKVVDSTWTLLEVTVIDDTTIEVTMDVADPVLVFALPLVTTVTLPAGWNLLSTPILLDADSDSLGQIFGTDMGNIEIFYSWDAVNDEWALLTNDYELLPLYGIYVKVSWGASATAEFIVSQELSWLPSRELQRGLNLIGPAPALEAGVFPAMPLDQALSSIAEAEGGLRGYTMVVSPAHNQLGWTYALSGQIQDLIPFKGYWVVMENADTLYGPSTTPIE